MARFEPINGSAYTWRMVRMGALTCGFGTPNYVGGYRAVAREP